LAGITIVPGNVWPKQGAEYMFHILQLLHQSIAVHLGARTPLMHTAAMAKEAAKRWGPIEYMGAFASDPAAVKAAPGTRLTGRKPNAQHATHFMAEQIEKHPGEVTILALGPMTNIAILLASNPELAPKIKQIVFMGGNVKVPGNASKAAEFNFWFDPEAARI